MQKMSVGARLRRAAVVSVCAASMTTAIPAQAAQPPEGEAPAATTSTTEELPPQAEKHVLKAIQHFQGNAFGDAEEEFKRASFYAPKWRPLHFNLGVVAEAQGKIGTAVTEYKAFRPYASPDEQMLVDQRLDELTRRKDRIGRAYKRQIGLAAGAMTLGVASLGGAAALMAIYIQKNRAHDDAVAVMDPAPPPEPKMGMLYGGVYLAIFGLMLVGYSFIPLRNAIRSKRQLEGIALGPTRLKWNGGAGVTLRF